MIPRATLAGVVLEAVNEVGWVFKQGFRPYVRTFEVMKANAQKIMALSADAEVELVLERNEGKLVVKKLFILSTAPARHPDRIAVVVADRRWKWVKKLIRRDLNYWRRTGEFRVIDATEKLPIPAAADVNFAKFSKKDEALPWDATTAFEDIAAEVTDGAFKLNAGDIQSEVDVDGLSLRDSGDAALDRLCAFLPGLALWIDEEGIAQTTNIYGGGESAEIEAAGVPLRGSTLPQYVTFERSRASGMEVYFHCEDEIRFDFVDPPQTSTGVSRFLENVLPLPDTVTFTSGPRAGQRVAQGTWVPIDTDLLATWNADTASLPAIQIGPASMAVPFWNFADMRRLYLYPGGYNIYLEADTSNRITARRWAAFFQHYRATFRVPRLWVDRAFSFQPTMLSVVDPVNGTRAPSQIYADHCEIPTIKRIAFTAGDPSLKYAVNLYAWTPGQLSPTANTLASGKIADAAVLVPVDPDAFVFKLVFKPWGSHLNDTATFLPCAMASKETGESDLPGSDLKLMAGLFQLHASDGLSQFHRLSTVLALGTASPQGLPGLYKVTVAPEHVKHLLPVVAGARIGECKGPVEQIFVGPEVMTASSFWEDAHADEIVASVMTGAPRSPSRLLYPKHLQAVAEAVAARAYVTQADRWEGAPVYAFKPKAKPVGRIASVIHRLMPDGVFGTELDMSFDVAPPDWMAFLPENTRRHVFHKVQREAQT